MRRPTADRDRAQRTRVSPTATETQSESANIWALLALIPHFGERLRRGKAQLAAGEKVEFEPADRPR